MAQLEGKDRPQSDSDSPILATLPEDSSTTLLRLNGNDFPDQTQEVHNFLSADQALISIEPEIKRGRFHMRQSSVSDSQNELKLKDNRQTINQSHDQDILIENNVEINEDDQMLTIEQSQHYLKFGQNLNENQHDDNQYQNLQQEESPPRINMQMITTGRFNTTIGGVTTPTYQVDSNNLAANSSDHSAIQNTGSNIQQQNLSNHFQNYQGINGQSQTIIQVEVELPSYMNDEMMANTIGVIGTGENRQTVEIVNSTIATTQENIESDMVSVKGRFRVQERNINSGLGFGGHNQSSDFMHSSNDLNHDHMGANFGSGNDHHKTNTTQEMMSSPKDHPLLENNSVIPKNQISTAPQESDIVTPRIGLPSLNFNEHIIKQQSHRSLRSSMAPIEVHFKPDSKHQDMDSQQQNSARKTPKNKSRIIDMPLLSSRSKSKSGYFNIKETLRESSQENSQVNDDALVGDCEQEQQMSWQKKLRPQKLLNCSFHRINRLGSEASLADREDNIINMRNRQSSEGLDKKNSLQDEQDQKQIQEEVQQEVPEIRNNILTDAQEAKNHLNDSLNEADESCLDDKQDGHKDQSFANYKGLVQTQSMPQSRNNDLQIQSDDAYFYPQKKNIQAEIHDDKLQDGYKYSSELRSDKSQKDIESPNNQSHSLDTIQVQINNNQQEPKPKGKKFQIRETTAQGYQSNIPHANDMSDREQYIQKQQINQSLNHQINKYEWPDHHTDDQATQNQMGKGINNLISVHESLEYKSRKNSAAKNDESPQSNTRQKFFLQNSGYQAQLDNTTVNLMNNTSPSQYNHQEQLLQRPNILPQAKVRLNSDTNEMNNNNATIGLSSSNFNNEVEDFQNSMLQIQLMKKPTLLADQSQTANHFDSKQNNIVQEEIKEEEKSLEKRQQTVKKENNKERMKNFDVSQIDDSDDKLKKKKFILIVDKEGNMQKFTEDELTIKQTSNNNQQKKIQVKLPSGKQISAKQPNMTSDQLLQLFKKINIDMTTKILITNEPMNELTTDQDSPDYLSALQQKLERLEEKKSKKKQQNKKSKKQIEKNQLDPQRGESLTSFRKRQERVDGEQKGRFIIKNSTDDKNENGKQKKSKNRGAQNSKRDSQKEKQRAENSPLKSQSQLGYLQRQLLRDQQSLNFQPNQLGEQPFLLQPSMMNSQIPSHQYQMMMGPFIQNPNSPQLVAFNPSIFNLAQGQPGQSSTMRSFQQFDQPFMNNSSKSKFHEQKNSKDSNQEIIKKVSRTQQNQEKQNSKIQDKEQNKRKVSQKKTESFKKTKKPLISQSSEEEKQSDQEKKNNNLSNPGSSKRKHESEKIPSQIKQSKILDHGIKKGLESSSSIPTIQDSPNRYQKMQQPFYQPNPLINPQTPFFGFSSPIRQQCIEPQMSLNQQYNTNQQYPQQNQYSLQQNYNNQHQYLQPHLTPISQQSQLLDQLFKHEQAMFGQMLNCHQHLMQNMLISNNHNPQYHTQSSMNNNNQYGSASYYYPTQNMMSQQNMQNFMSLNSNLQQQNEIQIDSLDEQSSSDSQDKSFDSQKQKSMSRSKRNIHNVKGKSKNQRSDEIVNDSDEEEQNLSDSLPSEEEINQNMDSHRQYQTENNNANYSDHHESNQGNSLVNTRGEHYFRKIVRTKKENEKDLRKQIQQLEKSLQTLKKQQKQ